MKLISNSNVAVVENAADSSFFRIVKWSMALAFAFAGASIQALRFTPHGLGFEPSTMTWVAAAVGAAFNALYWRLAVGGRRAARLGNGLLALATAGLFLYPLRFVPSAKQPDIYVGLVLAVCAISCIAGLLYRFGRFLEADKAAAVDAK